VTATLKGLTNIIIGAAIEIHRELRAGMLEAAYQNCLAIELLHRGLKIERQKLLPLMYKGKALDCGCRLDLLVEGTVAVEVPSRSSNESMPPRCSRTCASLAARSVCSSTSTWRGWLGTD
jgi:GxxExxY protein